METVSPTRVELRWSGRGVPHARAYEVPPAPEPPQPEPDDDGGGGGGGGESFWSKVKRGLTGGT